MLAPMTSLAGARAAGRRRGLRRPGPAVHQPHHPAARRSRTTWDLGEVGLSLLLLMMVLLAGAGLAGRRAAGQALAQRRGAARRAARRRAWPCRCWSSPRRSRSSSPGSRRTAWGSGWSTPPSNMQAVAVEHAYGRPILPSFHGAWTAGGVVGAGLTLVDPRPRGRGRRARRGPARGGARRAVPAPRPRRARRRRRRRAVAADRAGRRWRWCSSTWSTPRRPPGDRRTSTAPSPPRPGWSPWRPSPTSLASGLVRAGRRRAGRAASAPVPVLRVGAVVASASLAVVVFAPSVAGGRRRLHPARRSASR